MCSFRIHLVVTSDLITEATRTCLHLVHVNSSMIMDCSVWSEAVLFISNCLCVCRVATLDRSGTLRSRLSVWRMLFWITNWHYRCVSWWLSRGTAWSFLRGERSIWNSWESFTIRYIQLTSGSWSRNHDDWDSCIPHLPITAVSKKEYKC